MEKKPKLKFKKDKKGLYGLINSSGKWIIAPQFDYAWDFDDGIATVKQNGKYGYIKEDGTYLFEPQFDEARYFIDGIAVVEQNNKEGYIKRDGTYLFEPQFDVAWPFENGMAEVKQNGKYGYIKEDGTYLFEPQFDEAWDFDNGIARFKQNDKYGFIKNDGTFIVGPDFNYADHFHDGKAMVWRGDKAYNLSSDGTLEEIDRVKSFVRLCDIMQNEYGPGWSFLEASNNDGKWEFKSWARIMDDNHDWYDSRWDPEEYEDGGLIRYYDEVEENKRFAEWATSLKLQTPEEVGELLWANAQQLIDSAKIEQDDGGYRAPLRDLTVLMQLYWQLKNIEDLGLAEVRNHLDLPKEKELYLHSQKVKRKAIKLCAEQLALEDDFEVLDFTDLIEKSHTPGEYNLISSFEDEREDDEDWYDEEEEE